MTSTITATPPRSPLSHIIDALRLDNRALFLETLKFDPRHPDDVLSHRGAPTGTTNAATASTEGAGNAHAATPAELQKQQLLFGTVHLRRTLLRNVLKFDGGGEGSARKKKKRKQNKNKTQVGEEEEMMSDLNEELLGSFGSLDAPRKCITRSNILSANGEILSPYTQTPTDEDDSASITTYVLRGGGFDLPSLSHAVLHRRKMVGRLHRSRQQQSKSQFQSTGHYLFRFVFVPQVTQVERSFLGELGVVDDFDGIGTGAVRDSVRASSGALTSLESLPIDLIPLDDDVLSLELAGGSSLRVTCHEGDCGAGKDASFVVPSAASLRHSDVEGCEADVADVVARSLMKLQLLNRGRGLGNEELKGAIPRVQGLGPLATAVIDRMMTLRMEEDRMESQAEEDEVVEEEDYYESDYPVDGRHSMDEVVNDGEDVEIRASPSHSRDNLAEETCDPASSIDALLVIDRKIDLVTPMLTPLTYEGLIDDVLGIQVGGCISVQRSLVEADDDDQLQSPPQMIHRSQHHDSVKDPTVVLSLNDSDPLYTEVRDKHVEIFGTFLQNQAKALKESHSQFTNRETARDLTEIHQFVKQIPVFTRNLRSLTNHIHIAELVKRAAEASTFRQRWQTERSMLESEPCYEVLEDLIASGEPPYRWLRLLCLQSLTSNGIKATRYDFLRKEVVLTYGYEFLLVLNDLEKAGFLRKRETFWMDSMATSYSTLRKALNLINAEVDPSNPEDVAYASSGYAPMTVRWVQASMRGYAGLEEAMRELPAAGGVGVGSGGGGGGRWIDIEQRFPPESLADAMKRPRAQSLATVAKLWLDSRQPHDYGGVEKKPVLLLYFVGGVTFMEIAALRFLSKRPSFPYSIVCCTTEIVNGTTLLQSLSC